MTGGNRGIGKEIVLALTGAGTDVVLTYRSNEEEALSIVEDVRAMARRSAALKLDLEQPAELEGFIAECSALLGSGPINLRAG